MEERKRDYICPSCGEWNFPKDKIYVYQCISDTNKWGYSKYELIERCKFICCKCGARWSESNTRNTRVYHQDGNTKTCSDVFR